MSSYAYGVAADGGELGGATVVSCRGSAPSTAWSSTCTGTSEIIQSPTSTPTTQDDALQSRSTESSLPDLWNTGHWRSSRTGQRSIAPSCSRIGSGPAQRAPAHDRTAAVAW